MRAAIATLLIILAGAAQAAPVRLNFWHYLSAEPTRQVLGELATEFNRSQNRVQVVPTEVGDYKTLNVKTIAALRGGGLPAMALADNAFFTRLALGGALAPLDDLVKTVPATTTQDFFPVLWDYGKVAGNRYGLPWAASTLLLYYNTDAFRARGLKPPTTWEEFGAAARQLSGRGTKGAVFLTDAWQFASFTASRGGSLLTKDERPAFDGPDAVSTLEFFRALARDGALITRSWAEINVAMLDFLRTKAFMVVAPSSAWPMAFRYSYAFKPGVVPLPGRTLAGESQLVVFKNASPTLRRGAFEFWQFLTRPENLVRWSSASYYLPARKSLAGNLTAFGEAATVIGPGLTALDRSLNFPRLLEFHDWRSLIETALERSLKGGTDPKTALAEAQRMSLAARTSAR